MVCHARIFKVFTLYSQFSNFFASLVVFNSRNVCYVKKRLAETIFDSQTLRQRGLSTWSS